MPKQPPFGEFIIGHEYAGTIIALREGIDEFKIGDRVTVEIHKAGGYFPGDTVAVLGPGAIGLMAVQCCKAIGAGKVILTGTRSERLELGKKLGADHVINIREEDPVKRVRELTGAWAPILFL